MTNFSRMPMLLPIICFIGLAIFEPSHAQNTQQDYLNGHNVARKGVSVPNMTWDSTVASYALNYSNSRKEDCNLVHSSGPYGENLAKGTGSFSGKAAVDLWVAEKPCYNYTTNSLIKKNYTTNSCVGDECRHYTQVIWRDSVRVGCARVQCNNGWWFITCNYDPPGNYVNEIPY